VAPAQVLYLGTVNVCALILKVQQRPQFEAGIRDGQFDAIGPGLILGFRNQRVLINVEYAPYFFVLLVVVLELSRLALGFPL